MSRVFIWGSHLFPPSAAFGELQSSSRIKLALDARKGLHPSHNYCLPVEALLVAKGQSARGVRLSSVGNQMPMSKKRILCH